MKFFCVLAAVAAFLGWLYFAIFGDGWSRSWNRITNFGPCRDCASKLEMYYLVVAGKAVTVIAYLTLEFENMTACPSKDDTTIDRCLWLNIDDGPFKSDADYARYQTKLRDWQRFNRQTVILRASFDKNEKGHVSMWPGGMGKVCGMSLP